MLSLLVKIFTLGLVDLDKNESVAEATKPVEQPKPVEAGTPAPQVVVPVQQPKPVEAVKPAPQVVKSIPVEVASAKQQSKPSGKKVVKPAEQKTKTDQKPKVDKSKTTPIEPDDVTLVNNNVAYAVLSDEPVYGTVSRAVEPVADKPQDVWTSPSTSRSSRDDWSNDNTPTRSSSNDYSSSSSSSSSDSSSSSSSSSDSSSSSSCSGGGCD